MKTILLPTTKAQELVDGYLWCFQGFINRETAVKKSISYCNSKINKRSKAETHYWESVKSELEKLKS